MQLENVFEQLVRIFNCFYALNSTTEFLFELADSFSAGRIGRRRIGTELADNFSLVISSRYQNLGGQKNLAEKTGSFLGNVSKIF